MFDFKVSIVYTSSVSLTHLSAYMAFSIIFTFLLFGISLTDASPCYTRCIFEQCVQSTIYLSARSDRPQLPAICRNERAIGVAASGRAFLFDSRTGTLTPTFSYIFKTQTLGNGSAALSVTAAAHRGDNADKLKGSCVVLSIRYAQILDSFGKLIDNLNLPENSETNCVAFTTADLSQPIPSYTSNSEPSSVSEESVTPQVTNIIETPMESETPSVFASDQNIETENTPQSEPSDAPELSSFTILPTLSLVAETPELDNVPSGTAPSSVVPNTPEPSMPITPEMTLLSTPEPKETPFESTSTPEEPEFPEPSAITISSPTATAVSTPDMDEMDERSEPSTSPEILSVAEIKFKEATTRSGDKLSYSAKISANGSTFDYSFSATLRSSGVISLESIVDEIEFVVCSENSVSIELSDEYSGASPQVLFPTEAVVVVNPDLFSGCSFGTGTKIFGDFPDTETNRIGDEIIDHSELYLEGYLIIKSSIRQGRKIVIEGEPSTFAAAFDEGELLLNRVVTDTNSTIQQAQHSGTTLPALNRETKIPFERDVLDIFKLSGEFVFEDKTSLDSFKYSWGLFGVTVETIISANYDVTAQISASLSVGAKSPVIPLLTLVSVPIPNLGLGVPIDTSNIKGNFKLPPFKIGLFFEVPLILSIDVNIQKSIFTTKVFKYSLGKKQYLIKAQGIPPTFVPTTVDLLSSEESTSSVTWDFENKFFNEPLFASLEVFIGVRPQLAFYIGPFVASLSADIGINIKGERALANQFVNNAFPPDTKGIGVCDTCHISKISASAVVGAVGIYGRLTKASIAIFGQNSALAINILKNVDLFKYTLPGKPISALIQQVCLEPEFGDETVTCGKKCCDGSTGQQCLTVGQEQRCDASPTPSPSVIKRATTYTDPHLFTFDRRPFSCQASGEFIMASSEKLGEQVQARFNGPDATGSVTTGVSIKNSAGSTIQLSVASTNSTSNINFRECAFALFVNGVQEPSIAAAANKTNDISIETSGSRFNLRLPSGAVVTLETSSLPSFGCFFRRFTMLVPVVPDDNDWIGLFGSPNNNDSDDWMYRNGTVINARTTVSERLLGDAYEYCSQIWCIRNQTESLFTYEAGSDYNTFFKCDDPYEEVDFTRASVELQQLCGDNVECLVDGIAFGEDLAVVTLEVQQDLSDYTPGNLTQLPVATPSPLGSIPPPSQAPMITPTQLPTTPLPTLGPITPIPSFNFNFTSVSAEVSSEQVVGAELTMRFDNPLASKPKVFHEQILLDFLDPNYIEQVQYIIGNASNCNFSSSPLVGTTQLIEGALIHRYPIRILKPDERPSFSSQIVWNYVYTATEQDDRHFGSFALINGNGERVKFDEITASDLRFNEVSYNGPADSLPVSGDDFAPCFGISTVFWFVSSDSFDVTSLLLQV